MENDGMQFDCVQQSIPYAGDAFDVRRDVYRTDDTDFSVEYLDTADAVTVLAFTTDGEVLVLEEWRYSVGRTDCGLPGGQLEPGDDGPADAARRELREETGYEAGSLESLGAFEPLNSLLTTRIYYFAAHDCQQTDEPDPDVDEQIRVDTRSLAALRDAVCDGAITDTRTAFAVLYASSFL
ncbi:NUDIX hydrolase [Natrarchaeobaculum aegyptiacum]|uniref:Nudix hydrolase domain-containing protein n=1 Tax=Natrarchaeobaculum aegyptiacum TaxID=745377 RepID=A0A2Z2HP42_9EURY|nr:NUDIX hydrolase [Natrarchaeobaculum aegyptiacum]ARS88760.1 hypothetical protein B1756_02635 [Natrarchaeobaculum aegyptiacum]